MRRRSRPGAARLLALLLLAGACRAPTPRMLEMDAGAPGSVRVVVAPMNLGFRLAMDLEDAVEPVGAEMIRYFQAHGAHVAVIWEPDAWTLWRAATRAERASAPAVETEPGVEIVAAAFSRALAEHADFDLLVIPSLIYRDARVTGRFANWDGVRRRIRFSIRSPVPSGIEPAPSSAILPGQIPPVRIEKSGHITGLSLHVLAMTPQGHPVFQSLGGLDLVHDAVQEREGSAERPFLRLQSRLLRNDAHVREGIALALDAHVASSRSR